ncbi:hypothetical protein FBUS_08016 [Fasciolopsis buskii]|uniref:Uncharacterized protein n=1 Tax=Fasciolopsis buskii TaxID=27845 RepID=A0A8E0VI58_9TREM|nr:hypothetical protein FBUS_08016 [Fasciolopsis buski]
MKRLKCFKPTDHQNRYLWHAFGPNLLQSVFQRMNRQFFCTQSLWRIFVIRQWPSVSGKFHFCWRDIGDETSAGTSETVALLGLVYNVAVSSIIPYSCKLWPVSGDYGGQLTDFVHWCLRLLTQLCWHYRSRLKLIVP